MEIGKGEFINFAEIGGEYAINLCISAIESDLVHGCVSISEPWASCNIQLYYIV